MSARTDPPQGPAEMFRGFPVKIEIFEGPLDLLLHLVRRQELEIAEIQIALITEDYLRHLETLSQVSVDLAGEFLVMASNLMWLKSRMLLPRQEEVSAEEDELLEEEFIKSEEELRRRLDEYRAYKEAAGILAESQQMRQRVFLRALTQEDDIGSGFVPLGEVSLFDMVSALQEMLARTKEPPPQVVRPPEITVADCIEDVLLRLHGSPGQTCRFVDLVDLPTTRVVVIMVFLAVLELIRRREIQLAHDSSDARQIVVSLVH